MSLVMLCGPFFDTSMDWKALLIIYSYTILCVVTGNTLTTTEGIYVLLISHIPQKLITFPCPRSAFLFPLCQEGHQDRLPLQDLRYA